MTLKLYEVFKIFEQKYLDDINKSKHNDTLPKDNKFIYLSTLNISSGDLTIEFKYDKLTNSQKLYFKLTFPSKNVIIISLKKEYYKSSEIDINNEIFEIKYKIDDTIYFTKQINDGLEKISLNYATSDATYYITQNKEINKQISNESILIPNEVRTCYTYKFINEYLIELNIFYNLQILFNIKNNSIQIICNGITLNYRDLKNLPNLPHYISDKTNNLFKEIENNGIFYSEEIKDYILRTTVKELTAPFSPISTSSYSIEALEYYIDDFKNSFNTLKKLNILYNDLCEKEIFKEDINNLIEYLN